MQRWVQFWQIADAQGAPLPGPYPARAAVRALRDAKGAGHRLYHYSGAAFTVLLDPVSQSPNAHIAAYRLRDSDLPSEELDGAIGDLSINANARLAEGTHYLFLFRNVLAVLYNHQGPRPQRFADAMSDVFPALPISVFPIYRQDLRAVLDAMQRVTKIELSIPASQVHLLGGEENSEIAQALETAAAAVERGHVRLELSVGMARDPGIRERLRELAQGLVDWADLPLFRSAKVHGALEGQQEAYPLDLIQDQLVTRVAVDPETSRSTRVANREARRVILGARDQFTDLLASAVAPITDGSTLDLGPFTPSTQAAPPTP